MLMTAVPAQAAGVKEMAVVAPPTAFGAYNPDLLATCHELGVSEVYRVGGAQAVAALAYGVEGLPPVDKIVGPGQSVRRPGQEASSMAKSTSTRSPGRAKWSSLPTIRPGPISRPPI